MLETRHWFVKLYSLIFTEGFHDNQILREEKQAVRAELVVALKDQLARLLLGFEEKLHSTAKLIFIFFYLRDME